MVKGKCDIIIPVYNSPEWVKLCVYSIFKNTEDEILNKVYLIDDCSNEITKNLLKNLKNKYKKIELVNNEENLGFVKTTNKGMKLSNAEYVLLLNTDCIIAKNTIGKLINHLEKDTDIGMISPLASNAANVSIPIFPGFSYMQMDQLFEKHFFGKSFDACTIVGNCLMITRKCIEKTGYLDEIFGMGYGEETDYQFKAMEKGFKAKIAIDTYVFHKAEVSFGNSKEKMERLEKNRKIFFDRWGNQYYQMMAEYEKNDPVKYVLDNINKEDRESKLNFVIYVIGFVQNAGGVHNIVDLVNYLSINNLNCNIVYETMQEYKEIMLFNPIHVDELCNHKIDKIVSTIYLSTYISKKIADEYNIPLIYYSQGYETLFENGINYGIAELSFDLADYVLTISDYLKKKIKYVFGVDSYKISNGINYDLIYHVNKNKKPLVLTFVLRNNYLKGDFIAIDMIKNIINNFNNLEINVLCNNDKIVMPFCENDTIKINKMSGNFSRIEIIKIFQNTDIYFDTSLTEGFGLMALEALTAGAIPIVSNSGGISEYIKDGKNGFIINDVNNVDSYLKKLKLIIDDNDLYNYMKKECQSTSKKFDYDNKIDEFVKYFNGNFSKKEIVISKEKEQLFNDVLDKKFKVAINNKSKSFLYRMCRLVPKKVRIRIKMVIEKIYIFTNER